MQSASLLRPLAAAVARSESLLIWVLAYRLSQFQFLRKQLRKMSTEFIKGKCFQLAVAAIEKCVKIAVPSAPPAAPATLSTHYRLLARFKHFCISVFLCHMFWPFEMKLPNRKFIPQRVFLLCSFHKRNFLITAEDKGAQVILTLGVDIILCMKHIDNNRFLIKNNQAREQPIIDQQNR